MLLILNSGDCMKTLYIAKGSFTLLGNEKPLNKFVHFLQNTNIALEWITIEQKLHIPPFSQVGRIQVPLDFNCHLKASYDKCISGLNIDKGSFPLLRNEKPLNKFVHFLRHHCR